MFQMENILLSDQGNAFLYFHPESSKNGPSGGQQCLCNKSHSYTVVLKFVYCILEYFFLFCHHSGHLRLSDFGLSRRLKRSGRAFTICGTIQYMGEMFHRLNTYLVFGGIQTVAGLPDNIIYASMKEFIMKSVLFSWAAPEVLSGGPYNHAADWWSLGIMLFSLVSGEVRTLKETCILIYFYNVNGCRFCVCANVWASLRI